MSRSESLALVVGCVLFTAAIEAADCNGNGVDDSFDLMPGDIELETERIWQRVGDPSALVAGDWNSDGRVDLATANRESFNVSVLLNLGDGSLGEPVHYDIGGSPGYLAPSEGALLTSDLNGDGRPDLVVGTESGISVLLNRGDGTFENALRHEVGGKWFSFLRASDLNGDGRVDMVWSGAGGVVVLLGLGDGTFEEPVSHDIGGQPRSLVALDLSGDANLDLVVGAHNGLFVLPGRGDGTFEEAIPYEEDVFVSSVLASDLNGDGTTDVVWTSNGGVSVLLGGTDGISEAPVHYDTGGWSCSLLAGDLDGDGITDLAGGTSGGVSVLLGGGDGTFEEAVRSEAGESGDAICSLLASDLDGDGTLDLAGYNMHGTVVVLLGRGDGTFEEGLRDERRDWVSSLLVSDLNGDAKTDLVGAEGYCYEGGCATAGISVFLGQGDGSFEETVRYEIGGQLGPLLVSDLDGDGNPDLAALETRCLPFVESCTSRVLALLGRGEGAFEEAVRTETGEENHWEAGSLLASDFDGDGKSDLATARTIWGTSGAISVRVLVFLGRGDGTFEEAIRFDFADTSGLRALTASDLDGDGKPDLVVGAENGRLFALLGRGDGTFEEAFRFDFARAEYFLVLTASDLNEDGKPDLVAGTNNGLFVLLGRGDGTFEEPLEYETGESVRSVFATDLNGDGKTDLAAVGELSREGDSVCVVLVFLARGDGAFEEAVPYGQGMLSWGGHLLALDVNGDGKTDLAANGTACDRISGCRSRVIVLPGRGDGTFEGAEVYETGLESVGPLVVSDLDGDNRADLALTTFGGISVLRNQTRRPVSLDRDQNGVPDECQEGFIRGDANADGAVDISDAIATLGVLFLVADELRCEDAADSNDDGAVDVSDAIRTLGVLFLGQGVIPFPGTDGCGVDPTRDKLECTVQGCL